MDRLARFASSTKGHAALYCVLLLLISGCQGEETHIRKLDLDPAALPYRAGLRTGYGFPDSDTRAQTFVMADLEGDGLPEAVSGSHQKILGHDLEDGRLKARFEIHLADDQCLDDEDPVMGVARDFNGDGIDEICFTTRALDHSTWYFQILDPAQRKVVLKTPLPVGEDRRRPHYWDGSYVATGVLPDADGQGTPGVVLVRRVGYDASLRGVCVVSPVDGRILWEYICGAQPSRSAMVTDLEGDGRLEIVFFTTSPDNLDGRLINGTTDNQSHIIVLSDRGEELMVRRLGSTFFDGEVRTADLDADGVQELVTCTFNNHNGRSNEIIVWDWTEKEILARTRSSAYFLGMAIVPGPRSGSSWIVAGTDDGTINRYLYADGVLHKDLTLVYDDPRCHISGAVDILPEPGPEIVADLGSGSDLVILNTDLEPLAHYADDTGQEKFAPTTWQSLGDHKNLVLGSTRSWWVLDFEPQPFDWAGFWRRAGLGAALLTALAAMFTVGRISGRRSRRTEAQRKRLTEATDREALFRLQRELDDVHHQVVGRTKGLERLVWLLDASTTGLGNQEELKARIEQVMFEFRETVHPRLLVILRLAREANFETDLVQETTFNLETLYGRIESMISGGSDPERIAGARDLLRADWEAVRDGFLALRTSVSAYFTTDPVRMLKGMILLREGEIERARVDVRLIGDLDDESRTLCNIDHGDLHFILENLIDNAVRAMRESPSRNLVLQVERKEGEVAVHVSDSGRGIAPEHVDKLFNGRFSTRPGGGLGLHRSREILQRWGGEIQLAHTFPGKGTTFIVKLSTAAEPAALRTLSASG